MTGFAERLNLATDWENEVADAFRSRGWCVEPYGQALLTKTARDALRRNPHAQHRWLPDLLAFRQGCDPVLIDAKATKPEHQGGPNFSMEKASLSALVEHEKTAVMPVFIVFYDWRTIRAFELWALTDTSEVRTGPPSRNGSGTPYWLIRRDAVLRKFGDVFPRVST